jgi:major membrane immunogen (membrane-anchored lipoprotein)
MLKNTWLFLLVFLGPAFVSDSPIKDGQYSGTSRSIYVQEPFYGHIKIVIEGGKIIQVYFTVFDSAKHEYFNGAYEKYFEGNDLYVEQCRKDWKGIQSYPDSLLKYQHIDKVDVISGATWSYNIFKASVQAAMIKAIEQ